MIGFAVLLISAHTTREAVAQEKPYTSSAEEKMALDPGNKMALKLVKIPAGSFLMGSPQTEKDRDADEAQHPVTLSNAYFMGATHVTVDQFAEFVKDAGYITDAEKGGTTYGFVIRGGAIEVRKIRGMSWRNPGFEQKGDHPVVLVSWNDANAFCTWLSARSGRTVALPTEAQWEYANRAGATTAFPWGDNADGGKGWANCADQSLHLKFPNTGPNFTFYGWDDGFVFTSPVGSFKANAFGLYDMTGNAWEWCHDRYGKYEMGPVTDPTGASSGSFRAARGGSWADGPAVGRSANRGWFHPGDSFGHIGFRIVVAAADK